mgnify:CR=1 FL=1
MRSAAAPQTFIPCGDNARRIISRRGLSISEDVGEGQRPWRLALRVAKHRHQVYIVAFLPIAYLRTAYYKIMAYYWRPHTSCPKGFASSLPVAKQRHARRSLRGSLLTGRPPFIPRLSLVVFVVIVVRIREQIPNGAFDSDVVYLDDQVEGVDDREGLVG